VSKIRCAVIGAGHLGKIHARIMQTLPEFELAVIVEPLEAARAAAAETYRVPVAADYRPWLDRIDAAIVATPTKFHRDVAADLLAAGKHVFVEKPLASTVSESEALVEAARRSRTVLQVGHVERFNPAWTTVRPKLAAPRLVECRREGAFTFRSTDVGVVYDLMIHDIDLVASLVGEPVTDVEACGQALLGRHEDTAYARLRFASGCIAVLHASRVAASATRQMRVRTDGESAVVDFQTRTVQIVHVDPQLQQGRIDVELMSPAERDATKQRMGELLRVETITAEPCDAITAEQRDFAGSIREGRRPLVSGRDGLEAVRIARRIVDQLRKRQEADDASKNIVRPPHWHLSVDSTSPRREAG
jgi:predicted dehydrogenase